MLNRIEAFEVQYWYFELLELIRCLKVDGQIEHRTLFRVYAHPNSVDLYTNHWLARGLAWLKLAWLKTQCCQ